MRFPLISFNSIVDAMARLSKSSTIRFLIALIFSVRLQLSYQLTNQLQRSKDLTLCAQNSADNTLKTYWSEINSRCIKDSYKLMDLYETMRDKTVQNATVEDKCSKLLFHQLRKTLIDTSATFFEDTIITATLSDQMLELQKLSKRLSLLDSRMLLVVWERAIDEVYWFVNKSELAEALYRNLYSMEAKLMGLIWLYWKYEKGPDLDADITTKIAYYLSEMRHHADYFKLPRELQQGVEKTFANLPQLLRQLYATRDGATFLGILNKAHWEYLYAPRDNGPDNLRRMALTWSLRKNSTDSDGQLTMEVDSAANIAIASFFESSPKYLYVDEMEQQPYFWIGKGVMPSRWWRVKWHKEDYLTFENVQTQHLLCATREYDEHRRYVTLEQQKNGDSPDQCRWIVTDL